MVWIIAVAKRCKKDFDKALSSGDPGIKHALKILRNNPRSGTNNRLRGPLSGFYKLRKDPWRIVYSIDPEQNLVIIGRIGTRDDVYINITDSDFII